MTYTLENVRWAQTTVRWSFVGDDTGGLQAKAMVEQAFSQWSKASGLTFVEVSDASTPSIRIGYANLNPAGTGEIGMTSYSYAGTFLTSAVIQLQDPRITPIDAGGIYANWSASLPQVAEHEIGHAIGLGHDTSPVALMNGMATDANRSLSRADIEAVRAIYQDTWTRTAPVATVNPGHVAGLIGQVDTVTGVSGTVRTEAADSSVDWLSSRYILGTDHSVSIAAVTPFAFIVTGAGDDAIEVKTGDNIIAAGGGSNFISLGSGTDTVFIGGNDPFATWSTMTNFHVNDMLTIWGYTPGVSKTWWEPSAQGTQGFTGATMRISMKGDGAINESVTFADMSVQRAQDLQFTTGTASAGTYLIVRNAG